MKKDGTVWSWGIKFWTSDDPSGKDYATYTVAPNREKIITTPVKIASDVKQIAVGNGFSVILKKNGAAYWKGGL